MHDEEGPRRLRQGADTPESLQRALSALRTGVDDSARLQRVGQKLESVLGSPPSAAHLPARRGLFGGKLSALKLVIAGLGLLAPLFFFQLMDDVTPVPSSDGEGSPLPSAAPQIAEKVDPAPIAQPAVDQVIAPEAAPVATNTKRASRSQHAAATRPRKLHERERASAAPQPSEDNAALDSEPAAKVDIADAPRTASTAEPSVEPEQAPAAPRAQPKPTVTQEPPRVSEAELLLKARQALSRDPALALRLASEHQAQYANGRLTPEREVLAIEALRKLGRKAEADERLHKFEARYPESIHLKRLRQPR